MRDRLALPAFLKTVGSSLTDMQGRVYKTHMDHNVDRRDPCPPIVGVRSGLTGLVRRAPHPLYWNRNCP